ncbi:MAG: hypothetical protein ACRD0Q_08105 [Acidimicrobiales bacterium]
MRTNERGMVAVELPLALGLLLLPLALLVITLPTWPERQTMARAAANEAARTVALADSWDEGMAAAVEAVNRAATNEGIDAQDVSLSVDGSLERRATVTVHVRVRMPALNIPGLTTISAWSWTASHSERVDDYRSLP